MRGVSQRPVELAALCGTKFGPPSSRRNDASALPPTAPAAWPAGKTPGAGQPAIETAEIDFKTLHPAGRLQKDSIAQRETLARPGDRLSKTRIPGRFYSK